MPYRECSPKQICNLNLMGAVCFILFCDFIYLCEFMILLNPSWKSPFIIITHIILFLLLWSLAGAVLIQPGMVPLYWGLYTQQYSKSEERKYCIKCHSFKPQRCHHCSTCSKCVLDLDHHCPWISNCVGFFNRKHFMLFLFYTVLILVFIIPQEVVLFVQSIQQMTQKHTSVDIHFVLRLLGLLAQLVFLLPMPIFLKHNLSLVLQNSTTLEEMIKDNHKNKGIPLKEYDYDLGTYDNFVQVFGQNQWMWLLPITGRAAGPTGTGTIWKKKKVSDHDLFREKDSGDEKNTTGQTQMRKNNSRNL